MKVKSEREVVQCPTLHDPIDCSLLGSSVHGIFQARVLEWVATGKTIALIIWTFVSKVLSFLFNTLSRFVIAFLPRSKRLFILELQSPSTVILEPKKIKSATVSIFSPSICLEVIGPDANPMNTMKREMLGLPKGSFIFSCKRVWRNPNELFPNPVLEN